MSDMQQDRPGEPGTSEGDTGPQENDPVAPSGEGRDAGETADE
jgi:hypothetical protein